MITAYLLIDFGKTVYSDEVHAGDMIKNEIIHDKLHQITLLSELNMPQLEEDLKN